MTIEIKRPERKFQDVKVTEEDIILFTLGIDKKEFLLPSERNSYLTDPRAVSLVEDIKKGKVVANKDYRGINLKGADISGADLTGCDFSKACFYQTKAKNCCFKGAKFDDAYIEETDLTNSVFSETSLKRLFLRNNQIEETYFDEKSARYFSDFNKFLSLVESGKIDIRTLTKNDLLSIDLRRLDLTKVDLTGIDLSQFVLDGINLCGAYIDPKQLLSLASLQKTYFDLRRTKDKKRRQMEEQLLKEKEEEIHLFGLSQKQDQLPEEKVLSQKPTKKSPHPTGYILWPQGKEEQKDEYIEEETIVETPLEALIVQKQADDKSQTPSLNHKEQGMTKVSSKQREIKKTNTKTKG